MSRKRRTLYVAAEQADLMLVLVATLLLWAGIAGAAPDYLAGSPDGVVTYPGNAPATVAVAQEQEGAKPLRPKLRPPDFDKAILNFGRELMQKRGAVCNDWTILGQRLKSFAGTYRGCGISDPVRVHMISGIELSQKSLMDCRTAVVLKTWLETTAKPVLAEMGDGLKKLHVVGHYSCRTRNNQPGGRISEHGKGRAIDISTFQLVDGTLISVLDGWNANYAREAMRKLHSGACGLFGTVLGPGADRFHQDHFHFDTARRRSAPYCR